MIEDLLDVLGNLAKRFEIAEADILDERSILEAVKDCEYVVHTAAPYPLESPLHENHLVKPAVNGTIAICKAAFKHKVKRVVITSSIAAIMYGLDTTNTHKTPEDWTQPENAKPYPKSKTLAEKAAWNFHDKLPDNVKFELTSINPGIIVGPGLLNPTHFASGDLVKLLMMRGMPGVTKSKVGLIDIRDCALAHLQAIKVPEAANKRFILVSKAVWFKEVAGWLHDRFAPTYPVVKREIPKCLIQCMAYIHKDFKQILSEWNVDYTFQIVDTLAILGITSFRDTK